MKNLNFIIGALVFVMMMFACQKDDELILEIDDQKDFVQMTVEDSVDYEMNIIAISEGFPYHSNVKEILSESSKENINEEVIIDTDINEEAEAFVPFYVTILGKTDVKCYGESTGRARAIAHYGIGAVSYRWSNGQSGGNLRNVSAGIYSVTATDEQGRTAETDVLIEEPARPLFVNVIESSDETCIRSGLAEVNGAGGTPPFTYEWSWSGSSMSRLPLPVGRHVVRVTDANGCTAEQMVVIGEDKEAPAVVIDPVPELNCRRERVVINATFDHINPDIEYSWSTDDGSIYGRRMEDLIVDGPGTYELCVRNSRNGCVTCMSVRVDREVKVISSGFAGEDVNVHYNSSVELTANPGIPVVRYSWSPAYFINGSSTGRSITTRKLKGSKTFTLEIEDTDGCTFRDEVTVNVISHPADPVDHGLIVGPK